MHAPRSLAADDHIFFATETVFSLCFNGEISIDEQTLRDGIEESLGNHLGDGVLQVKEDKNKTQCTKANPIFEGVEHLVDIYYEPQFNDDGSYITAAEKSNEMLSFVLSDLIYPSFRESISEFVAENGDTVDGVDIAGYGFAVKFPKLSALESGNKSSSGFSIFGSNQLFPATIAIGLALFVFFCCLMPFIILRRKRRQRLAQTRIADAKKSWPNGEEDSISDVNSKSDECAHDIEKNENGHRFSINNRSALKKGKKNRERSATAQDDSSESENDVKNQNSNARTGDSSHVDRNPAIEQQGSSISLNNQSTGSGSYRNVFAKMKDNNLNSSDETLPSMTMEFGLSKKKIIINKRASNPLFVVGSGREFNQDRSTKSSPEHKPKHVTVNSGTSFTEEFESDSTDSEVPKQSSAKNTPTNNSIQLSPGASSMSRKSSSSSVSSSSSSPSSDSSTNSSSFVRSLSSFDKVKMNGVDLKYTFQNADSLNIEEIDDESEKEEISECEDEVKQSDSDEDKPVRKYTDPLEIELAAAVARRAEALKAMKRVQSMTVRRRSFIRPTSAATPQNGSPFRVTNYSSESSESSSSDESDSDSAKIEKVTRKININTSSPLDIKAEESRKILPIDNRLSWDSSLNLSEKSDESSFDKKLAERKTTILPSKLNIANRIQYYSSESYSDSDSSVSSGSNPQRVL